MQLQRDKGLCFTCDEKFSWTHRCPNRQYLLLLGDDDDPPILEPDPPDHSTPSSPTPEAEQPHLSFNALKGSNGLGTFRFQGSVYGLPLQILLYNGNSDNFLQPCLAHFLKHPVEPAATFQVLSGNGNNLTAEDYIQKLEVQVQGHTLQLPVYLLPVAGDGDQPPLPLPAQYNYIKRMSSTNSIVEMFALQIHQIPKLAITPTLPYSAPELQLLLQKYQGVFAKPKGLPPDRPQNHSIPLLEGSNPIKVKPYMYPHNQKDQINKMVSEMLADGIIHPSTSPLSSPVLLVKKKDGTWRFCTDHRALNAITIKDSFLIPTVDELLDELFGATHFSKLDLRSSYHQILVQPEDIHKTAFRAHQGLYEWLVMPFGLTNAPASFQSLMNQVFQQQLRKSVLVFVDDILVYSPSWSSHLVHLEEVLSLLQHHYLFAKFSKCSFGLTKIDYLGHTVSGQGVEMDQSKVRAVLDWPEPSTIKQLRGFLCLTGYYRRFIKGYTSIALTLTELLKKDGFLWDSKATTAFNNLKQVVTNVPVLALPDFGQPFILETDASGSDIGAVLSQAKHPIAYFSKKLSPRMQKQSTYVRELYAISEAISKFRHYLLGHKFC